jgi:hypothetical protein
VVGGSLWFERKAVWPTKDGLVDMKFYVLSYMEWAKRCAKELMESGREFHRRLIEERERLGHPEPKGHPDEEAHDLHVGSCIEMIHGGQVEKGVIVYNRWARFAGYGQIALLQRNPIVLDLGDCVLLVQDKSFKVISCRQVH